MSVREQVPMSLRGPVGVTSLGLFVLGAAVGYILVLLGITLYFNLNGIGSAFTSTESLIVVAVGLTSLGVGYVGWKGFNYFSY